LGIPRYSQWVTCRWGGVAQPSCTSPFEDMPPLPFICAGSRPREYGSDTVPAVAPWGAFTCWCDALDVGGGPRRWLCAHLLSEWHGGGDGSLFGSTPILGRRELRYTWQCLVVIRQVWIMPRSPLGSGSGVFYRIPMTLSLPCTILIDCRQNRRSMIRGRVVLSGGQPGMCGEFSRRCGVTDTSPTYL
jgi:hypothetical protein